MSRSFRACFRKEWLRGWSAVLVMPFAAGLLFYQAPESSMSLGWYMLASFAVGLSYVQMSSERSADSWAFAVHRGASGVSIFAAKLLVGVGALLLSLAIGGSVIAVWASVAGDQLIAANGSLWLTGIAAGMSVLMLYAAGLHAFSSASGTGASALAFFLAILGAVAVSEGSGFGRSLAVTAGLTVLLAVAACAQFVSRSDFEGQPLWGRAANVITGGLPVAAVTIMVGSLVGWSTAPHVARATTTEAVLSAVMVLIPAVKLYAVFRGGPGGVDASVVPGAVIAMAICLISVGLVHWLCQRYAFSERRMVTWVVLAALTGPIALALMWIYIERPPRERCRGCGGKRVVSRDRCAHCDAPFAAPQAGAAK